jgi:hypothetical protein
MSLVLKNNAVGLLQLAIGAGATSTTLQGGHTMPVLGAGDYTFATFVSPSNTLEVVKVTAIVGDVITHAATSNAFDAGSRFELRPCLEAVNALMQEATSKVAVTMAGTDTYTGTASPVPTSYVGIAWILKFTNANTIAAPTVNLNALGAKTIKNRDGAALVAGDIKAGSVHVAFYDGTNMILVTVPTAATIIYPRGHLSGCTMSTAGGSATMSIAAGQAVDSTTADFMTLAAIGKTTSAWAVGTGNGGLDTGAIANSTWYHFFIIKRPDTGVVDVLFSLSATAPTMPANYTLKRRIGAGKTDGSAQWTAFLQIGDCFQWKSLANDSAAFAAINTVAANYVVTVPTGVAVEALLQVFLSYNSNAIGGRFFNPSLTDAAISSTSNAIGNIGITAVGATSVRPTADLRVLTDTSAQVRAVTDNAPNSIDVRTRGWIDLRGKD